MVKNRIRALLAQHQVQLPQVSDLFGQAGTAWLKTVKLAPPDGALLLEDRELLSFLKERVKTTEKLIQELAKADENYTVAEEPAWCGHIPICAHSMGS